MKHDFRNDIEINWLGFLSQPIKQIFVIIFMIILCNREANCSVVGLLK